MKIDKPLYLPDLIRLQGGKPTKHTIQRVRRFLRRTEERLGVTLLIQEYEGGPYYTTITLLRRWLSETVVLAVDAGFLGIGVLCLCL